MDLVLLSLQLATDMTRGDEIVIVTNVPLTNLAAETLKDKSLFPAPVKVVVWSDYNDDAELQLALGLS